MKQTKPEHTGASQLIPGVIRTSEPDRAGGPLSVLAIVAAAIVALAYSWCAERYVVPRLLMTAGFQQPLPTLIRVYWHLGAVGLIGGVTSMALLFPDSAGIRIAVLSFGLVLLGPASTFGVWLGEALRQRIGNGPIQTTILWLALGLVLWAAWRFAN